MKFLIRDGIPDRISSEILDEFSDKFTCETSDFFYQFVRNNSLSYDE